MLIELVHSLFRREAECVPEVRAVMHTPNTFATGWMLTERTAFAHFRLDFLLHSLLYQSSDLKRLGLRSLGVRVSMCFEHAQAVFLAGYWLNSIERALDSLCGFESILCTVVSNWDSQTTSVCMSFLFRSVQNLVKTFKAGLFDDIEFNETKNDTRTFF